MCFLFMWSLTDRLQSVIHLFCISATLKKKKSSNKLWHVTCHSNDNATLIAYPKGKGRDIFSVENYKNLPHQSDWILIGTLKFQGSPVSSKFDRLWDRLTQEILIVFILFHRAVVGIIEAAEKEGSLAPVIAGTVTENNDNEVQKHRIIFSFVNCYG